MTGKIRIIFLIGQIGKGGSERQLYLLLKGLNRTRFDPSVVVFNSSPNETYKSDLEASGIKVAEIPSYCCGFSRRARWLYTHFKRQQPRIVHSWTVHDNPYAGVVGRAAGVPVRIGSVRSALDHKGFRRLPGLLRFLSLRSVPCLVVNSRSTEVQLTARGLGRQVFVLANCVERATSGTAVADLSEFGIESRHRLIGVVGNLRPVKNHALFIRAMAEVLPSRPDVRAVIVGHPIEAFPGLREALIEDLSAHGLEGRVILTGFQGRVPQIMNRLALFCLTSNSEGMPNTLLEAMAAGVPVVSTAVGGAREIVRNEETGILVEPGNVEAFASSVARLIDDPVRGRRMGQRGLYYALRDHDCDRKTRRLEEFYEDLMTGSPNEPRMDGNAR